jgi:hypothetical protein
VAPATCQVAAMKTLGGNSQSERVPHTVPTGRCVRDLNHTPGKPGANGKPPRHAAALKDKKQLPGEF